MEVAVSRSAQAPHNGALWRAADALVDAAPTLHGLRWHRLHLLAADPTLEPRDVIVYSLFSDAYPESPSAQAELEAFDAAGTKLL